MRNNDSDVAHGKSHIVYEWIIKKIFSRELLPGQPLVERDLAGKLGLSKTPVREALLRLKEDGLVVSDSNSRVFVAHIKPQDAMEIFDIREMLEGLAARRAAEKAGEQEMALLDTTIKLMKADMSSNRISDYSDQDLRFHYTIVQISGNARLQNMLRKIRMQSKILMSTTMKLPSRGMTVSLSEHRKVLEAIKSKNPELAEEAARNHIRMTRSAATKWLNAIA